MFNYQRVMLGLMIWLGKTHSQLQKYLGAILRGASSNCISFTIPDNFLRNTSTKGIQVIYGATWGNLQNLNGSDGFPIFPNATLNPKFKVAKVPSSCASLAAESLQNSGDQWGGGASPCFFWWQPTWGKLRCDCVCITWLCVWFTVWCYVATAHHHDHRLHSSSLHGYTCHISPPRSAKGVSCIQILYRCGWLHLTCAGWLCISRGSSTESKS